MKITDILKLDEALSNNDLGTELIREAFNIDTGLYIQDDKNIETKDYMRDQCFDDRSRTVEVVFFKGEACFITQYLGRGDYEGVDVINKEAFKALGLYVMGKVLDREMKSREVVTDFKFSTYGANYLYIIDNTLTCSEEPIKEES